MCRGETISNDCFLRGAPGGVPVRESGGGITCFIADSAATEKPTPMDLSLSEQQRLLQESVARFARENGGVDERRRQRDRDPGFDRDHWAQFAELGWLALPFAEEEGGLGGSAIDTMVVMEQFGRGLCFEPYLITVCVCGGFLAAAAAPIRATHLPPLIAGESQWAFAFVEENGRHDPMDVACVATASGDGFVLRGAKVAVLNGHCADFFVVTARTAGARRDRDGVTLFIVPAAAPGLSRHSFAIVDGTRAAHISLNDVRVERSAIIGGVHAALELVDRVMVDALIAIGAETLGAMDALLEQTVAYAKTRVQFGQPIGRFQALQHRMADMYLAAQSTRSLLYYAAIARAEGRSDAARAAAALKVKAGEAGRYVSQQAVQLHGGIGMTDELAIGHYFKRLLVLNTLFGDPDYHLDRYERG
jgi:alkylation response protein AidB-like acyl-CoA dehydrogenase